jgi:8-oxo-dGTP pyrophosphatase MutT (NUDIX family)
MNYRKRASAVIIKYDQILLVKISDHGRTWWCLPGGTIEPDETPEQAIIRELQEELKLNAKPLCRLYKTPLPDEQGVDIGILVESLTGPLSLGIDSAVVEWGWFPLDQTSEWWQVRQVCRILENGC